MTPDAVAVTGIGLVTPAGIDASSTWDGMCRGVSTATTDPLLEGLPVTFSCRADSFEAQKVLGRQLTWRVDRFVHLALAAARDAVGDAGLGHAAWDATRVGVVVGASGQDDSTIGGAWQKLLSGRHKGISPTTIPRGAANMAAGEISLDLGIQGPGLAVHTACSSGATAISVARDLLRSGVCDIVLAGGSGVATGRMAAACFHKLAALSRRNSAPQAASRPFDADRDGFVLGEGAGILVLENARHARARGAAVRAYLAGTALTSEAHHSTAPTPDGSGAARTIRAALASAGLGPEDIDHVNAHGSATRLNDLAEAHALRSVFRTPPPVTAPKGVLGHAIEGVGAIEAALTVMTLQHQEIPPTANLERLDPDIDLDVVAKVPRRGRLRAAISNSFGFGGQNAVLVFTAA
ncbi:beta-ketoacyl-[acyl-carrier-protein] synthase family protein [Streptomyces sp. NPDC015127]|uniref:beta-ketoacyl-[acyl-carrier-protein] synthase family protein n=1 Tax=Streptomyces sp. NPDC015127 TaxID=3364939 RepID=UPI0036F64BCA